MREIVSLHIGKTGVEIADKCWELFSIEHELTAEGRKLPKKHLQNTEESLNFYSESQDGSYKPKSLFISPDISLSFPGNSLLSPDQLLRTPQCQSYSEQFDLYQSELKECIEDSIRRLIEPCSEFQGFLVYNSASEGGLASAILQSLSAVYPTSPKVTINLFQNNNTEVDLCNSIMTTGYLLDFADACLYLDYTGISNIYRDLLGINSPSLANIYQIVAEMVSHLTTSMRFGGIINENLSGLIADQIPYKEFKFLVSALAPIQRIANSNNIISPTILTEYLFENSYNLSAVRFESGSFMASGISYRGNIVPKDICCAIANFRSKKYVKFVDWCPTGFKCGINYTDLLGFPDSLFSRSQKEAFLVANTTAIKSKFQALLESSQPLSEEKLSLLSDLRLDQESFLESRENILGLTESYKEVEANIEVEEEPTN